MSGFSPSVPIQLQIRKAIFEKFNDITIRFTNDEFFDLVKKNGDVDKSWIVDNMEEYFKEICDKGLVRNIAQNFTTQWYRLFDLVEKIHCNSCNHEIYLGKLEERVCPNPKCGAAI